MIIPEGWLYKWCLCVLYTPFTHAFKHVHARRRVSNCSVSESESTILLLSMEKMDVAAFSMTLSPLYRQYQIFSHHCFPLHVRLYSLYFTNWHTFSFTLVMFDISAIALWLSEVINFEIHRHQSNISYFQMCIDTYCRTAAKVRVWEGVCVWVWWRQTCEFLFDDSRTLIMAMGNIYGVAATLIKAS